MAIVNRKGIGADDDEFNRAFKKLKADILEAIEKLKGDVVKRRLLQAVASRDVRAVAEAIPWNQLNGYFEILKVDIRNLFEVEAGLVADTIGVSFDIFNPRVMDWISSHTGELITNITAETQAAVQVAARQLFESGESTRWMADQIIDRIGLTSKQQVAVENYRKSLLDTPLKPGQLDKNVGFYRKKLLRFRAENIARTETVNAAAQGQQLAWEQGVASGNLDARRFEVRWSTSPNDACEICIGRNGARRPINGRYPGGFGPPTAHPQCRCVEVLVERKSATPQRDFFSNINPARPLPAERQRRTA